MLYENKRAHVPNLYMSQTLPMANAKLVNHIFNH